MLHAGTATELSAPRVTVEAPSLRHQDEFLAAVRRSRTLHLGLAAPPTTPAAYRTFLRRYLTPNRLGHFIRTERGELAGVININDIVRGVQQSGCLGYYAFVPHAGHGHMHAGLEEVLRLAFGRYGLHRVEAIIQPNNSRSIALVHGLGFRSEGSSPRSLRLTGHARNHERWALTLEAWQAGTAARHHKASRVAAPGR